jgi:hypothetical protein
MSAEVIDHTARADAQRALDNIAGHEDLCAERYRNIHELGSLMKLLGWGGSLVATTIIGLIGYLSVSLINANDHDKEILRAQVELLQATQQHSGSTVR